jgi:uncharacterized membrane protein
MFPSFTSLQELKQVMNVLLAIVVASCIIIVITMNMTDSNGLSALIGGYAGLLLGMLFIMIVSLIFTNTTYLDMFPVVMVIIITGLLMIYLYRYFDNISAGHVSGYYSSFSLVSAIFLFAQLISIFTAIYSKTDENQSGPLFKPTTFSLLVLLGVINMLAVITIGVVLHFYSTQG